MTGTRSLWFHRLTLSAAALLVAASASAQNQAPAKPFEPTVGQAGKDVVWVPTPQALVDKMLELAKVTPQDFVMDLGSGDGRTVITAAKLGATAMGIEYEPEMVALAQKNATAAGVSGKATFMKADLFETDFSKATVVTMFLLPSINMKLRPKILDMKPGTRVVSNTFTMEDWTPDKQETIPNCTNWCTALFWIVPAKVQGTWQTPQGPLALTQTFQNFTGTLGSTAVSNGKLTGNQITFTAGNNQFTGTVKGDAIDGVMTAGGNKTNIHATRSASR
jgi:hypothetical protein